MSEIVKFYGKEFTAKKLHVCCRCHRVIRKGEKYHKVRVKACIPYSKATEIKAVCMKCAEEIVLDPNFSPEKIVKNWREKP